MSTRKKTVRKTKAVEPVAQLSLWRRLGGWGLSALSFLARWYTRAGRVAVIGFFTRYWLLLAVLVGLVALVFSGWVFSTVGAMIWLPAVGVGGWAFVLLLINIFFRRTIDKDFDSGRFASEWDAARPEIRLILTVATTLALFLGYCLIANGLASR